MTPGYVALELVLRDESCGAQWSQIPIGPLSTKALLARSVACCNSAFIFEGYLRNLTWGIGFLVGMYFAS